MRNIILCIAVILLIVSICYIVIISIRGILFYRKTLMLLKSCKLREFLKYERRYTKELAKEIDIYYIRDLNDVIYGYDKLPKIIKDWSCITVLMEEMRHFRKEILEENE